MHCILRITWKNPLINNSFSDVCERAKIVRYLREVELQMQQWWPHVDRSYPMDEDLCSLDDVLEDYEDLQRQLEVSIRMGHFDSKYVLNASMLQS